MKIAFYKGTRPGVAALFSILVRWWLRGKYSHCELIFSDGISGSSSWLDGGVRLKRIDYDPEHWDIIEIQGDEKYAREWFRSHLGDKFDLLGLLGFVVRRGTEDKSKWFCSESVAAAIGFEQSWRIDPCCLRIVINH